MNRIHSSKVIFFIGSIVIIIVLISGYIYNSQHSAVIDIIATPESSNITINDKQIGSGINRIVPGEHKVVISKDGFTSVVLKVVADKNTVTTIKEVLSPNSLETQEWYKNNPDDQALVENISSFNYDRTISESRKSFPIVEHLSKQGDGRYFRATIGASKESPGDQALYVKLYTRDGKRIFEKWLQSIGFSQNDIEFYYQ